MRAGLWLSPWQGRQDVAERRWSRCEQLCPWGRCFGQLRSQLGPAAAPALRAAPVPPGRAGAARRSVRAQRSGAGERASSAGQPGQPRGPALLLAFTRGHLRALGSRSTACWLPAAQRPRPAACLPAGAWPHAGHPHGPAEGIPAAPDRTPP